MTSSDKRISSVINHIWKVRYLLPGFLFWLIGCSAPADEVQYFGRTMGTTYYIRIAGVQLSDAAQSQLHSSIDSLLQTVNQQMSTYIEDSEVSVLNRTATTEPIPISPEMTGILNRSKTIYQSTSGAFDITVHPLVKLWGFGNTGSIWEPPAKEAVAALLGRVGSDLFTVEGSAIRKHTPQLEVDLSAIAKGYGADRVADLLSHRGYIHYMIEVGGEVNCSGLNAEGQPWKIGIQYPVDEKAQAMKLLGTVRLRNLSMATSGNYRNYFDYAGKRYSHMIDPNTGRPVENSMVSATVIARECMDADAYATALMVMDVDEGMTLIESLPGLECFLVQIDRGGNFTQIMSTGFAQLFQEM